MSGHRYRRDVHCWSSSDDLFGLIRRFSVSLHGLLDRPRPCLGFKATPPETLVTLVKLYFRPLIRGDPLFISFHPRSSIQYNVCYDERKYCKCCNSARTQDDVLMRSIVPFASAACNPRLQFLYKLFYNFWQKKEPFSMSSA